MKRISTKRKLIKIGNSLCVAIPSLFLKINDMKKGDTILIDVDFKKLEIKKAGSKPA